MNAFIQCIHNSPTNMRGKRIMCSMLMPIAFSTIHWGAAQIYMQFCAPSGVYGYIIAFFNVANPVCSYTLQVMDMSKYFYTQSWIFVGITSFGLCKHLYEKCTTLMH